MSTPAEGSSASASGVDARARGERPTRIALIHALAHSVAPINGALAREWPKALRMNLLDDSLSTDLAAGGQGLDEAMHQRFHRLGQYAVDCGCDAILFTCSAFGPCIEAVARAHAPLPVLKPNEAMIADAVAQAAKAVVGPHGRGKEGPVGLISSFAPTLISMPPEFPPTVNLSTALVAEAMDALNDGDGALHDELVAAAAQRLAAQGCSVIALAQFSMARARSLVAARTGLPVLTTVDSAVAALKLRLGAA